jgi:hypothetical protein
MALQLGATRDAFLAAGVPEAKAAAAAEELAGFETRSSSMEGKLIGIDGKLAGVDARLALLTWAVGIQAAATLAILASTFAVWARLGDIAGQIARLAQH